MLRLSSNAIQYALEHLLHVAGLHEPIWRQGDSFRLPCGLTIQYSTDLPDNSENPQIVIIPCHNGALQSLLENASIHLHQISIQQERPLQETSLAENGYYSIPVIVWGKGYEDGTKPFAERYDHRTVVFYADIIAATFFMLSRWEETVLLVRDQHERFPAPASLAYRQKFLDRPIIDEYALILQAWIKILLPSWVPKPPRFSIKLSHDIDHVRTVSLRQIGGAIVKRRDATQAIATIHQWFHPDRDPAFQGCYELASLSEQHGLQSAFFFMAADRSTFDSGYNPCSHLVQELIHNLQQRGHEVGFHPGYQTFNNPDRFYQEKQRMDQALGATSYGGRQHYLRFQAPDTWRLWSEAGLTYDSTAGYADHEGFRCGTCHPFRPYDITHDSTLNILEIPLIVMDGTLKQYRHLTPEMAEERILMLARRCKAVNGVFSLLWHNTSLYNEWSEWATMYRRVLAQLTRLID